MKLSSVELHPINSSEIAILSFRDPGAKNPYNVKAIIGLDAESIIPKYYKGSGDSGFYNMSLENREIVILISLNPVFGEYKTYSDLRDALYRIISSSRTGKLQLQFKDDSSIVAAISGFVVKIEAPLFEKIQQVQLTIKCDEPMLRSLDPIIIKPEPGSAVPAIILDDKKSTAPHGFSFDVKITEDMASIVINDPDDASWSFEIAPTDGFLADDILIFGSEFNNKYVWIQRDFFIPIADRIIPGSVWPIMFPGYNKFSLNTSDIEWIQLFYYPTYWGV